MTVLTQSRPVTSDPVTEFAKIPGLGPELAARIAQQLRVQTLEQLELAAHTGRLQTVPGIGAGRARRVREAVAKMLARPTSQGGVERSGAVGRQCAPVREAEGRARLSGPVPARAARLPVSVTEILIVDREYRRRARAHTLPTVAPRRFNPTQSAFLPVYRIERQGTHFTAFYSNSPAANAMGKTHDWVIVIARSGGVETQFTVVTETRGSWSGQRVVRGREHECRELYGLDAA